MSIPLRRTILSEFKKTEKEKIIPQIEAIKTQTVEEVVKLKEREQEVVKEKETAVVDIDYQIKDLEGTIASLFQQIDLTKAQKDEISRPYNQKINTIIADIQFKETTKEIQTRELEKKLKRQYTAKKEELSQPFNELFYPNQIPDDCLAVLYPHQIEAVNRLIHCYSQMASFYPDEKYTMVLGSRVGSGKTRVNLVFAFLLVKLYGRHVNIIVPAFLVKQYQEEVTKMGASYTNEEGVEIDGPMFPIQYIKDVRDARKCGPSAARTPSILIINSRYIVNYKSVPNSISRPFQIADEIQTVDLITKSMRYNTSFHFDLVLSATWKQERDSEYNEFYFEASTDFINQSHKLAPVIENRIECRTVTDKHIVEELGPEVIRLLEQGSMRQAIELMGGDALTSTLEQALTWKYDHQIISLQNKLATFVRQYEKRIAKRKEATLNANANNNLNLKTTGDGSTTNAISDMFSLHSNKANKTDEKSDEKNTNEKNEKNEKENEGTAPKKVETAEESAKRKGKGKMKPKDLIEKEETEELSEKEPKELNEKELNEKEKAEKARSNKKAKLQKKTNEIISELGELEIGMKKLQMNETDKSKEKANDSQILDDEKDNEDDSDSDEEDEESEKRKKEILTEEESTELLEKVENYLKKSPKTTVILQRLNLETLAICQSKKANILARVQDTDCPICLSSDIAEKAITHCQHTFCHECISKWNTTNNKCPICKTPLHYTILHSEGKGSGKPSKREAVVGLMKKFPNDSFVIFSENDHSFTEDLSTTSVSYKLLRGASGQLRKTIDDFKAKKFQLLCINTKKAGAGLDLGFADQMLEYHLPSTEFESIQTRGRLQRMGRTRPLIVNTLITGGEN